MDGRIDYCELAFEQIIFYYYYCYYIILEKDQHRVCSSRDSSACIRTYIYIFKVHIMYSYNIHLQKLSNFKNPPSSPQNPGHLFESNYIILGYTLYRYFIGTYIVM